MSTAEGHVPEVLPRGRAAAPRDVVWRSQHGRMLAAMASAAAEKGYARVAVADVIERASVSRRTFYEHFDNKQECFFAAYDAAVDLVMGGIDEAIADAAPDWAQAATSATQRYLEMLASNPDLARTFLVEVLAAGPEALRRRALVHERFARQLRSVHETARRDLPELPAVSDHRFRASVGAINELVVERLEVAGAEALPALFDAVMDVQMTLLVGDEASRRIFGRAASR